MIPRCISILTMQIISKPFIIKNKYINGRFFFFDMSLLCKFRELWFIVAVFYKNILNDFPKVFAKQI